MDEPTLLEIFGAIGDKRFEALEKRVGQKLQEPFDINQEIENKISLLQGDALRRGTETQGFKDIVEEIAFLVKIAQALKE